MIIFLIVIETILLVIQCLFILIFIGYFVSGIFSVAQGAPYSPMRGNRVKRLLELAELSSSDILYDLGCGDGRILISARRDFGVQKAVGYEIAPWPRIKAKLKIWQSGLQGIYLRKGNFFKADISEATFIYMYLFPKLVDRLADKLKRETRSGTKILCPSFPIDLNKHPEFTLKKEEKIGSIVGYVYVLK